MGTVTAKIKISNPSIPKNNYEGEFLVDTGAKYSVVPEYIWKKLAIKPDRVQEFSLADGTIITRPIGSAFIEYQGIKSTTPLVLGSPKDSFLLGVVTLENLGLSINPFTREIYNAKLLM